MDRRLVGVGVLVIALVAVLVLPAIGGRRIAGSAATAVFPEPPRIGDCLSGPLPPRASLPGIPPEIPVTAVTVGPCQGEVAGEVVAIWADAAQARQEQRSALAGPCYRQAADYAGLEYSGRSTDLPGAPGSGPVVWKPTVQFDPYLLVPGPVEQRAGRTWSVCAAVPILSATYRGTLRDAFTTGVMPDEFGLCWEAPDLDTRPALLRCDEPHPAELLATGFIRDRKAAPTEVIESTCQQIAGRIMQTADPTRGGQLVVVADRMTAVMSRDDAPLTIGCFVAAAGAQQLSGTLIGLGDDPVPFRT